tara:strand:- start:123 stop:299 length:177 start_codon:yes stop_codon:yes gene_type:complete
MVLLKEQVIILLQTLHKVILEETHQTKEVLEVVVQQPLEETHQVNQVVMEEQVHLIQF